MFPIIWTNNFKKFKKMVENIKLFVIIFPRLLNKLWKVLSAFIFSLI